MDDGGKGGDVTRNDPEDWRVETSEAADHLKAPYNQSVKGAIEEYGKRATAQQRPETVAELMSKYPSEPPLLSLNLSEAWCMGK